MRLIAERISVNGKVAFTIKAVDADDELLPYGDRVGDLQTRSVRARIEKGLVEDLGVTAERAHAAVQQLFLQVQRDVAEGVAVVDLPTEISARLPGLVDLVAADKDEAPAYLFVQDERLVVQREAVVGEVRYIPPDPEHLPYLLPREAQVRAAYTQDTPDALYADLLAWHNAGSKLRDVDYHLCILFDFHTYRADDADYSPITVFASAEPERGKSRQGKAIAFVAYRGIVTETLQEANLFRWADSLSCTIFFDVRDLWTKAQKRGSDDIILGRFDRHGPSVARVLDPQAGPFKGVRYFTVYGPTVAAVNEGLREPLTSRCVIIIPPEATGRYANIYPEDGLLLRERLVAWRARTMATPLPTVPKPADGRLGDILQPLGQIAHLLGGDAISHYEALAKALATDRRSERAESAQARLVGAIAKAVEESTHADKFSVTAVGRHHNEGVPEDQRPSDRAIGVRVTALGFRAAGRIGNERARWRDPELLTGLCRKFGVDEESGQQGAHGDHGDSAQEQGGGAAEQTAMLPPSEQHGGAKSSSMAQHGGGLEGAVTTRPPSAPSAPSSYHPGEEKSSEPACRHEDHYMYTPDGELYCELCEPAAGARP